MAQKSICSKEVTREKLRSCHFSPLYSNILHQLQLKNSISSVPSWSTSQWYPAVATTRPKGRTRTDIIPPEWVIIIPSQWVIIIPIHSLSLRDIISSKRLQRKHITIWIFFWIIIRKRVLMVWLQHIIPKHHCTRCWWHNCTNHIVPLVSLLEHLPLLLVWRVHSPWSCWWMLLSYMLT